MASTNRGTQRDHVEQEDSNEVVSQPPRVSVRASARDRERSRAPSASNAPRRSRDSAGGSRGARAAPSRVDPATLKAMHDVMKENMATLEAMMEQQGVEVESSEVPAPSENPPAPVPPRTPHPFAKRESEAAMWKEFRNFKPPEYTGFPGSTDPFDFVEELENIGSALGCPGELLVTMTSFQLKEKAKEWWNTWKAGRSRHLPPPSWPEFREAFTLRFIPRGAKMARERDFNLLVQGQLTVDEYDTQFSSLARFVPQMQTDERARMERFVSGLRPFLYSVVSSQLDTLSSYSAAVDIARVIELGSRDKSGSSKK